MSSEATRVDSNTGEQVIRKNSTGFDPMIVVRSLASLKFTVFLLGLSTFMVLVATLEQCYTGIWDLKRTHFGEYTENGFEPHFFVYMNLDHFVPPAWKPTEGSSMREFGKSVCKVLPGLWLPSGFTVILLLIVNLTAAHLTRFKVRAKSTQLLVGLAVLLFGLLVTGLIVFFSQSKSEIQGKLPLDATTMWVFLHVGLAILGGGVLFYAFGVGQKGTTEKVVLSGVACAIFGSLIYLLFKGQSMFGESGMRILWQLFQGTIAGLLLLIGSMMIFGKRGGVVLLHAGICMLLLNEIFVSLTNVEQRMSLYEGDTSGVATDVRACEFVVYDADVEDFEEGVVFPKRFFRHLGKISHDDLPFDFQFVEFHENAEIQRVQSQADLAKRKASHGIGLGRYLIPMEKSSGASTQQTVDMPCGYVQFFSKQNPDESYGIHLVGEQAFRIGLVDTITVDGKTYNFALRLKRIEKPYKIKLIDVVKENYPGTETPKYYASTFELHDLKLDKKIQQKVEMNDPLRYGNDTIYQSGYQQLRIDGQKYEVSTFQIVKNEGWMIPYMCCMFVVIGMILQIWIVFQRHIFKFIQQQQSTETKEEIVEAVLEKSKKKKPSRKDVPPRSKDHALEPDLLEPTTTGNWLSESSKYWVPTIGIATALICGLISIRPFLVGTDKNGYDMKRFGQIPVTSGGRVMPIDTLARNTLRKLSRKEAPHRPNRKSPRVSATQWYADLLFKKEGWDRHRVIRIDDPRIRHALKLPKRKRSTYTVAELSAAESEFRALVARLGSVDDESESDGGKSYSYDEVFKKRLKDLRRQREIIVDLSVTGGEVSIDERTPDLNLDSIVGLTDAFKQMIEPEDRSRKRNDLVNLIGWEGDADKSWTLRVLVDFYLWFQHYGEQDGTKDSIKMAETIVDKHYFEPLFPQLVRHKIKQELIAFQSQEEPGKSLAEIEAFISDALDEMPRDKYNTLAERYAATVRLQMLQKRPEKISRVASAIETLDELLTDVDMDVAIESSKRLAAMGKAYRDGDAAEFNRIVDEHLQAVADAKPVGYRKGRMYVEWYANNSQPFNASFLVYIFAFLFALGSWIFLSRSAQKLSFWFLCIGVAMQTFGLILRMYVSGRPPVTNLYSAALFVGWSAVIGSLSLELKYRIGMGNLVGAFGGLAMLFIAGNFKNQGDTIGVLQAVLDTQFWLATHVVTISMGYGATFLAGFLGVLYILTGVFSPRLDKKTAKHLADQIHLVTCVALLLSFFGTVLGGLWADDSWGRFWGWDPKENGALMIVLWNAVVLHARWGGVVRQRGLAALAIIGTIVVTWSFYGVNELEVGLHQYGRTEGTLKKLLIFWGIQLGICALAMLKLKYWWSGRATDLAGNTND